MALAAVRATIAHLLLPSRPAAIAGFVIAFVVDPIQCEAVRTRPHVCEKALEAMPATAHGDPAAAIARPVGVRRIHAPVQHALPGVVRAGAAGCCLSMTSRHTRIKPPRRTQVADDLEPDPRRRHKHRLTRPAAIVVGGHLTIRVTQQLLQMRHLHSGICAPRAERMPKSIRIAMDAGRLAERLQHQTDAGHRERRRLPQMATAGKEQLVVRPRARRICQVLA